MNADFVENWPEINETRVYSEQKFITGYANQLIALDKDKRFKHTVSETISNEVPQNLKVKAKIDILEHVNELHRGD